MIFNYFLPPLIPYFSINGKWGFSIAQSASEVQDLSNVSWKSTPFVINFMLSFNFHHFRFFSSKSAEKYTLLSNEPQKFNKWQQKQILSVNLQTAYWRRERWAQLTDSMISSHTHNYQSIGVDCSCARCKRISCFVRMKPYICEVNAVFIEEHSTQNHNLYRLKSYNAV